MANDQSPPEWKRAATLGFVGDLMFGRLVLKRTAAGLILHDCGDFIDDSAVDPRLRNDVSEIVA